MSHNIGILNYKGGTGKTTTAFNLAVGLSRKGFNVLCIDLDPQGNLSSFAGISPTHTLLDVLQARIPVEQCIVPVETNLDLLPSSPQLNLIEKEMWRMSEDMIARRQLAAKALPASNYDIIVMDYSPYANLLSETFLLETDQLIMPVAMNYLALLGTRSVLATVKSLREQPGCRLNHFIILPTAYHKGLRKDRAILNQLYQYFKSVLTRPIRTNVKLSEAASYQQSIFDFAPSSVGAKDYQHLIETVIEKAGLKLTPPPQQDWMLEEEESSEVALEMAMA